QSSHELCSARGLCWRISWVIRLVGVWFDVLSPRGHYVERGKHRVGSVLRLRCEGSFPTEPVTREAHPPTLSGEGEQEISHPSSSSEPHRSGGSAPPAVERCSEEREGSMGGRVLPLPSRRWVDHPWRSFPLSGHLFCIEEVLVLFF
ncbi:hypothetical protein Taro_052928, partial [Colocasia esculenta]|nr:hypothetical protein [Colocasia esculenta]